MRAPGVGLRTSLAAYWLVVCLLQAAGMWLVAERLLLHTLLQQQSTQVRQQLERLASECDTADCPAFTELARQLQLFNPGVVSLQLVDPEGHCLRATNPAELSRGNWGAFSAPPERQWRDESGRRLVRLSHQSPGGWRLDAVLNITPTTARAGRTGRLLLLVALVLAAAAALLGMLASFRLVARPLERLLRQADRLAEADFTFLSSDSGGQLGRLGTALRRMARRIEDKEEALRRQLEEQSRLNRELQQMQQGLIRSEKLASVGRLAAGVAHEVGNPISAVLGYLSMLRDEETGERERADMLERVESEVERIDQVIRDLLSFSRPSRGETVEALPADLAEEALALIRPQKNFKTIEFTCQVDPALPRVRVDPQLVRQVLVNLMLNALDVLDTGAHLWLRALAVSRDEEGQLRWQPGAEPLAAGRQPDWFAGGELHRVHLSQGGRWLLPGQRVVLFCVIDDGPGIAAENLERVFDPFFTTKEPGRGTGLGLSICHSAVAAMGGEIWVWSRPGSGSQFVFSLPVAKY